MKHNILVGLLLVLTFSSLTEIIAQKKYSKQEYIDTYKNIATELMQKSGVPASIILGQACMESSYGNSELTIKGKNHFGIKCYNSWNGEKVYYDDDAKGECFRKYKKDEDSFTDHSDFLRYNKRYASLFELDPTDYKAWAKGLRSAGYATNPQYTELLIKTIEENKLYLYDKEVEVEVLSPLQLEAIDLENFVIYLNRKVYTRNGVKFIIANEGDTYEAIAEEFKLRTHQLLKYNDLSKSDKIQVGQELYIKKKKSRADKHYPVHIVQKGENMKQIAQKYAIRLNSLYFYNDMDMKKDEQPIEKQEIYLRSQMRR
ncbi:MAG: glucosaminidase domain-containing protein [Prevotellaceae bacterium]|jgi:LysM repeat protein|nr:glucosaminidase domain-containing protein [Prevotellaceae bacterium]